MKSADHLEANIRVLMMSDRLRNAIREAAPLGEIVKLPDGNPAIKLEQGVIGVPPAYAETSRLLGSVTNGPDTVVLVFGLGVGHVVRAMRDRIRAPLIVFDPSPSLLRTYLEQGPCDLSGLYIVNNLLELESTWPTLAGDTQHSQFIVTPGYAELFPEELTAARAAIQMTVEDTQMIENTRRARYPEWITHALQNVELATRCSPVLALAKQTENVPAFIIGAGPSLDKNVKLLAEAAQKGIVFVVDAAGTSLDRHGIVPQFVVYLEAMNLAKLLASFSFADKSILAVAITSHPDASRTYPGPVMPFHENMLAVRCVGEFLRVPTCFVGGSVSTGAFSLAHQMGCSPLVLVGQDLAYTNNKTHADSSAFGGSTVALDVQKGTLQYDWRDNIREVRASSGADIGGLPTREKIDEVEAWGGVGTVISQPAFNSFRLWFEACAAQLKQAGSTVRLVNATEGGARVGGFEELTLRALLDELPERTPITVNELVTKATKIRPPSAPEELIEWAKGEIAKVSKIERVASDLRRLARNTVRRLEGGSDNIGRQFDELERLETDLRNACGEQRMVESWIYRDMQDTKDAVQDSTDAREAARLGLESEIEMAATLHKAANEVRSLFQDLIGRTSQER